MAEGDVATADTPQSSTSTASQPDSSPLPSAIMDDKDANATPTTSTLPVANDTPTIAQVTSQLPAVNINTAISNVCANCSARADHRCAGCANGIDLNGNNISPTFYCGQSCQRDHWKSSHKADCKAAASRQQLYTIATFVQSAFYKTREFCGTKRSRTLRTKALVKMRDSCFISQKGKTLSCS